MKVGADTIKLTVLLVIVFIVFVGIIGISILFVFHPLIEVLTVYPLLISSVPALFVFAYNMRKFEKSLDKVIRLAIAMFVIFWLFAQISTIIAVELRYNDVVNEHSGVFEENSVGDSLNSSWAVVVKYRNEFEGTYGRNESLPNRILTRNSGFFLSTPLFLAYFGWFDGWERLIVLQKKGNCAEFAIAIKTLLRDVTGLKTRVVHMEGFDHAFPEVYWNGSWWVFDGIFTTQDNPVKAEQYAEHLKENKRNVYENLYGLKEDKTGRSVLAEHGFEAVNITIIAIIDPTSNKSDDRPAKDALVEIFTLKNRYDPLVDRGVTDEEGKYRTVLRQYGEYVVLAKSSDNRFVGVLEVDGWSLKDGDEIVVKLHGYR